MALRTLLLTVGNILVPLACLVFAVGFFPYKPFIQGWAEYQVLPHGPPPVAPFNKVVFLVIDALRSDFVFSRESEFSYTHSLIRQGTAWPFTAHASAPTVTMPRIKALTTGSIPSFVDIILNIAEDDTSSSLATQDNWIMQMNRKPEGRAVMYGDDTWLKLFPDTFARADGTSSFFVSDFTEVDNNVTRHIPDELSNSDWNVLIMHYLGMDHIGHKSGPKSVNMRPKQKEMDAIVEQVYRGIDTLPHLQSTLLVLVGDHGMTEGGNHGGSAPGETSPALVFLSPKLGDYSKGLESPIDAARDFDYYDKVEQSDMAATLAGLLGFPVPLNNLGIILPQFLQLWNDESDRVQLVLRNALQMLNIVKAKYNHPVFHGISSEFSCTGSLDDERELACLWKEASRALQADQASADAQKLLESLLKFCKLAQEILSTTASNFKVEYLMGGITVVALAVLLNGASAVAQLQLFTSNTGNSFLVATLLYTVMMFASSFVEEEQQFWYWATSAWIAIQVSRRSAKSWLQASLVLLCLRIARRWNQSGQKFSGADDIAKWFAQDSRFGPLVLWLFIAITFITMSQQTLSSLLGSTRIPHLACIALTSAITLTSFTFKLLFALYDTPELLGPGLSTVLSLAESSPSLVALARVVFVLLGITLALSIAFRAPSSKNPTSNPLYNIFLLLLTLQTRTQSIPLLLLFNIQSSLLPSFGLSPASLAITALALSKTAYFATGGTNSISSLDLSLSYNGIAAYNPIPVGILLFVGNFGPALVFSLAGAAAAGPRGRAAVLGVTSTWVALETLGVMAGCAWLREHLFVWTVFSPRLLYEGAWVGVHLVGNVLLGSLAGMWCESRAA